MKLLFSLVCPARADAEGNRVRGCGRGWTSHTKTTACPGCGEVGEVRDVVQVYELAVGA